MIEVSIKDFSKAVQIAGAARENYNTIPVLGAMKVRANGKLELEATNLDMTARVAIPCNTDKKCEFLLTEPKGVVSAIGAAGGSNVVFEATAKGFKATAGQLQRTTEHSIPLEDWPQDQAKVHDELFSATLSPETLRQIERVAAAISKEARYYLNGINLKRIQDTTTQSWTYRFAATDGHRLIVVDVPLPDATGELEADIILPRAFVRSVFTHFRKAEGPLTLSIGTGIRCNSTEDTAPPPANLNRIALSGRVGNADVQFSSKAIDGKYPDYARVIPPTPQRQALFPVALLRRAVLAVSGGASTNAMPAISLTFDETGVVVGMAYGVIGVSAQYRIDCQHNVTPGTAIGFKAHYLLDMLNAMRGTDATFSFEDGASPCLIRDVSDTDFLAVLMPMRLEERRR